MDKAKWKMGKGVLSTKSFKEKKEAARGVLGPLGEGATPGQAL